MDTTTDHFTPLALRVRGKNGSHYRASEVIPLILGVFKNKIERRGRQNKNNRPINLPKVITFSTDFKYTTQSYNLYHTQ